MQALQEQHNVQHQRAVKGMVLQGEGSAAWRPRAALGLNHEAA
jgi:hypothetical protein